MSQHQFQDEISPASLKEFYKDINKFSWAYHTISGYTEFASKRKFKIIKEMIKRINPDSILDIGCGGGLLLREFSAMGFKVTGCDISHQLLFSIPKEELDFSLVVSDAENLNFKDNTFHTVICSEVLEHLFDYQKCLKEIYRVLKPAGFVLITVPNLHCYDSIEGKWHVISLIIKFINGVRKRLHQKEIYPFGYNTHIQKMTPLFWRNKIKEQGFQIKQSFPIFISPYVPAIFKPLKKIENKVYNNNFIFHLQEKIEKYLSQIYPFCYLGQLHLFLAQKPLGRKM